MTKSTTPLLISLKPYYSDLIFEGLKKAGTKTAIPDGHERP